MFSQLHAGMIGEAAPLGLAMMPEGFKVVVMRKKTVSPGRDNVQQPTNQAVLLQEAFESDGRRHEMESISFRLGWFPSTGLRNPKSLCHYKAGVNKKLFCFVAAHIARVGAVLRVRTPPISVKEGEPEEDPFLVENAQLNVDDNQPSPPSKKMKPSYAHETAKKIRETFLSENPNLSETTQAPVLDRLTEGQKSTVAAPRDRILRFVSNDGNSVTFVSLDVQSRFSPTEIDEQRQIHRQLKRRG